MSKTEKIKISKRESGAVLVRCALDMVIRMIIHSVHSLGQVISGMFPEILSEVPFSVNLTQKLQCWPPTWRHVVSLRNNYVMIIFSWSELRILDKVEKRKLIIIFYWSFKIGRLLTFRDRFWPLMTWSELEWFWMNLFELEKRKKWKNCQGDHQID